MITQVDFLTFMKTDLSSEHNYDWDVRPFESHMSDVWGEANRIIKYHIQWKQEQTSASHDKLISQINLFHDLCSMIYANATIIDDGKFELKIAQWELYDYVLWENSLNNNDKNVMRWYDQWVFSICHHSSG